MGSKTQRPSAALLLSLLLGCGSYAHQELPPTATAGTGGSSMAGAGGTAAGAGGNAGAAGGGVVTPSCDGMTPCGGDLIGPWTVTACMPTVGGMVNLTGLGLANNCTSAPITSGSRVITGTLTFNGDGSYADATETTGQQVYELPPACLVLSGTTTTCADIAGPLRSVGFVTNDCVDNPASGGCTCTATVDQSGGLGFISYEAAESGMYASMSQALSMSSYGDDTEYAYCVSGNVLGLTVQSVSRTGSVTSPIVLQK